jgi:hypothetical protein
MKTVNKLATTSLAALSFAIAMVGTTTTAQAQATRTWVSGVGDDVNPCSRTAPCKTFAGAISKTAAGGEINCLDPAGYGAVTITKSLTIDCEDTQGSSLNASTTGILLNDSATASPRTINVRIRGISINGGTATPGINGIRFFSAKSLVVDQVFFQNQSTAGLLVDNSAGTAVVDVVNSVFARNGGVSGSSVQIRPTGSGSADVSLDDVWIADGTNNGVRVDASVTTGIVDLTLSDSTVTSHVQGISVSTNATINAKVMVTNSTIANNTGNGIVGNGAGVQVRVAGTTITGNTTGVNPAGGSLITNLGNNVLSGNSTDGAFN